MQIVPDPIYETEGSPLDTILYQTEIARRFSLISQAADEVGPSGTVAFATWKQGIIRQGGPADVMARRFVLPLDFDPAVDNPFAYTHMACDQWAFTNGFNPRYVKGLCVTPAITLSGTTIVAGDCGDELACQEAFPWNDYFDDLAGGTEIGAITDWRWCDGSGAIEGCLADSDLDDTSWENPYDVAKGHRGFIDGDFLMVLYAWSPNWRANTVGHDNYNLYTRRSFDGGQTWTTTPGSFAHTDGLTYSGSGTTTCEWMGPAGSDTEVPVCTTYGAGDFEQARNLSQLVGTRETVLDPRFTPTPSMPLEQQHYPDDVRDPSRYFMVYETGDNTTVAEGEAEPLDLFYSRAVLFGDHYLVWQDEPGDTCLPAADPDSVWDLSGFCNEFDWIEGSQRSLSGEASVTTNAGGTFLYAIWNQEDLDRVGHVVGSDAWFRRVIFLDDYVPTVDDGTGPGNDNPPKPGKNK